MGMKQPKKKPAVPGCSNWTSLDLRLPKYRLGGKSSGRVPKADDQSERYDCKESLSEQAQSARMSGLEGECACRRHQKGRKCERRHTSQPQASILHWEAGLKPLYVR